MAVTFCALRSISPAKWAGNIENAEAFRVFVHDFILFSKA